MRHSRAILITILCALPGAALAQSADTSSGRLQELEQAIEQGEDRISEQEAEVARLLAEQEDMRRRSIEIVAEVQALENRLLETEDRIAELRIQEGPIMADLDERRSALTDILAALQSVERNKPPALLVRPDDAVGAARTAMLLGAVVPELEDQVIGLRTQLNTLTALRDQIEAEQVLLVTTSQELTTEQARLDQMIPERAALAEAIADAVASEREQVASFAAEADNMRELIGRLARRFSHAMPTIRPDPDAPPPPVFASRFVEALGSLRLPVVGRPLRRFGDILDPGTHSQGIALETRPGAPVIAPFDSEIVFAAPYRGYGELLILSPGDGYLILLSGLARIDGVVGQQLLAGEPVGVMGSETLAPNMQRWAVNEEHGAGRPVLYLEMREEGAPIDPLPWFREDQWRQDGT